MKDDTAARLVSALNLLAETEADLIEVRGRMLRATKVVYAARQLVVEWHDNPWTHENVWKAGQELVAVTRKYGMGTIHITENRDRTKASFKTPKAEEVFDANDLPLFEGVL